MDIEVEKLRKFEDNRGFLIEFLKGIELEKKQFGQIYIATLKPGFIRGNHYHEMKDEYFAIIQGKARLCLEDIKTRKRLEYLVDGDDTHITRIRVGKGIAHVIKNVGSEPLVLTAYATEIYDNNHLDQKEYKVLT